MYPEAPIMFVELPLRSGRALVQVASIIAIEERADGTVLNTTGGHLYLTSTYDETLVAMGQAADEAEGQQ